MVILLTGATGYVGSSLARRLAADGRPFTVAGRNPGSLAARYPDVPAVRLDALDPDSLEPALAGIDVAYYLIHSMGDAGGNFEERDRQAARNFATAALSAGVRRIVFLGGLGDDSDTLSHHLSSRHETGVVLAEHGPQVIELRAGIVIGSGSASFRMLADLVKRLPGMVTPKWVDTRAQPIGIDDVVTYLEAAAEVESEIHHDVVEIGGADVVTYRELMKRFARVRGSRPPVIVPVPVLTPRLSSLWCGLVTSVPPSIARPLIDGLKNEVVVTDTRAQELFPEVRPMGFDESVRLALEEERLSRAERS